MKFYQSIFLVTVLLLSCKIKDSTENDLKTAMQVYLYSQINNDSSKIKYNVKDVIFFNDKDKYICEFTVNMREFTFDSKARFDTTGIMKANISKDFKTVTRLY